MEAKTQYQTDADTMHVRDARTEKRFFVDNIIIQGYGHKIGVYGIAVYTALCMHSKKSTQRCFPSHKTIALEIGCSPPKVKETLRQLEQLKLIHVQPRYDRENRRQKSNLYTLLDPPVPPDTTDTPPQYRDGSTMNNPNPEQSEIQDPSSDDDDFSDLFDKPNGKPITTNLPTSAKGPLDLAAKTQKARAQEKQWTTPQGDADPWADKPLQGFCVLAGRTTLTASQQKHWPRELAKWALDWHATPDECYQAIKAIPDSEFHWMTFKTPFAPTFQETMDAMIDRIRNHQPINIKGNGHRNNGTQADPDLAAQINAAIEAKNAHRRANATAG